jgi:foldase protein PrsA
LTADSVKDQIRYALMQQKLITQGVTVTDKEVEDFYNQNKQSMFTTPEQVDAYQMTLPTEAGAKEAKQMLDKGANFELVAHSKSIDQYKDSGGKLPTVQKGSFTPPGISREVMDQIFKLAPGKVSDPIKSGNNWVIVKVDKVKPQTTRTLADVKEDLRQQLMMQKAQQGGQYQRFQQRMMELRRDADIQVGLDQFKAPIQQQQQQLKQQPVPGLTPTLPGGR